MLNLHDGEAVLGLLSNVALGLLRGECQVWRNKEPLTRRSQGLCARQSTILPTVAQP